MKNYMICGVAGFVGYHVASSLLKNNEAVFGIDDMNDNYDTRVKEYRLNELINNTNFHFLKTDVSRKENIPEILSFLPTNLTGLINLAAYAGVRKSIDDPWVYINSNVFGNLNLLEVCHQKGIPKYILASSSSMYSQNNHYQSRETFDTNHPTQPYAASKKGAEVLSYTYSHLYGIDVTILRFFTVYGPAGRPDMAMFRFVKWISEGEPVIVNGNGEQSRGFTYVDDIVKGIILALKPLGYEIINLGGQEIITINRLINVLENKIGKKANIIYKPTHLADIFSNVADITKAKNILDWEPKITLDDGINQVISWYFQERSWVKSIIVD